MCDQNCTKNDRAWNELFSKYALLDKIRDKGKVFVSAGQIKEFREPRLMTKFDHEINRPRIFKENSLSILPTSRGDYVISDFKVYHPLVKLEDDIRCMALPQCLQSLKANDVPSETIAINCAVASGILKDFLGEERLYATVSGRMGSDAFDFRILNSQPGVSSSIHVENVQIEIDAAFEGLESLALIEAKRDVADDFIVRQLYYPCRMWQTRVQKKVRPIFMVFSNGVYSLYEYEFQNASEYNSIELIKHARYSIEDDMIIEMSDLQELLLQTVLCEEPNIPFPQADSFERVVNICELLDSQNYDRDGIAEKYDFDVRQAKYYMDAARYLGLVDKNSDGMYRLSVRGRELQMVNYKKRQLIFCECILQHRVFRDVFELCCKNGLMPPTSVIVDVMRSSRVYNVESDSTYSRRASTVSGWINWMLKLCS